MRFLKIALFIAGFFVGMSLKCVDRDCLGVQFPFSYSGWQISALDNSGAEPVADLDGQALRTAFGLSLFSGTYLPSPVDTVGTNPDCNDFYPDTAIVRIKVRAATDFDATHPAGSDISDYWVLRVESPGYRSFERVQYVPLSIVSAELNKFKPTAVNNLLLLTPPPAPGLYEFSVELIRSDSSVITLFAPPVQLQ